MATIFVKHFALKENKTTHSEQKNQHTYIPYYLLMGLATDLNPKGERKVKELNFFELLTTVIIQLCIQNCLKERRFPAREYIMM